MGKGMRRACPESCMVVEDKAPCADGRRANGDGSCTEAGKDRPFCVRARANRFGGSNDEMCKRKGMRRACPESCMGHDDDNDDDDDAAAETNLVEDKAPCADGRRANGDGTCTEAGKDRPFCVRARANRFGGSNDEMCKRKGMRRACPESCMGHDDDNDDDDAAA